MGLDQVFYLVPVEKAEQSLRYDTVHLAGKTVGDFRKHTSLHKWLSDRFVRETGESFRRFNARYYELDATCLRDMYNNLLTEYCEGREADDSPAAMRGWGYGSTPEDWRYTVELYHAAQPCVEAGTHRLFYYCSW